MFPKVIGNQEKKTETSLLKWIVSNIDVYFRMRSSYKARHYCDLAVFLIMKTRSNCSAVNDIHFKIREVQHCAWCICCTQCSAAHAWCRRLPVSLRDAGSAVKDPNWLLNIWCKMLSILLFVFSVLELESLNTSHMCAVTLLPSGLEMTQRF